MQLDKLEKAFNEMFDFITDLPSGLDGFESDFDAAYKELIEAKSADVAPVVHGKWESGNPICPVCGNDKFKELDADIWADWMPLFCPNCGAKMDLEEDEQ